MQPYVAQTATLDCDFPGLLSWLAAAAAAIRTEPDMLLRMPVDSPESGVDGFELVCLLVLSRTLLEELVDFSDVYTVSCGVLRLSACPSLAETGGFTREEGGVAHDRPAASLSALCNCDFTLSVAAAVLVLGI